MKDLRDQPASPHGIDRWGEPVFGDGITTGSYVFMPQPGQGPGERDVFQVAFVGGRPGVRDELVAFGWLCDAVTGEWEPYWQSVGPNSVPTARVGEAAPDNPEAQQREPVRHAPGKVILCPDCRAKGNAVCIADEAQQPEAKPAAVEARHTCHDQKSAPGHDWECQWCSTLPDEVRP